jgi:hypothetical protein
MSLKLVTSYPETPISIDSICMTMDVGALAPPTRKSAASKRIAPVHTYGLFAGTEVAFIMTSVPAVLAPVRPLKIVTVTAPVVLFKNVTFLMITYGCVIVKPIGPASEVILQLNKFVVSVDVNAIGGGFSCLFCAMGYPIFVNLRYEALATVVALAEDTACATRMPNVPATVT